MGLEELYRQMVRIRVVEEGISSRYKDQEMRCPVHLSIGQEATAVGVCAHLKQEDWVFSTHRSHAHYLAKGGDLKRMLAELHGKATGCCGGRGGSMHLVDKDVNFYAVPIVASAIPIAVGVAKSLKHSLKLCSNDRSTWPVVACFFGDAALESGQLHEAFNLAGLWQLPILFVMEDNRLSVSTPKGDRRSGNASLVALAHNVNVPSSVFSLDDYDWKTSELDGMDVSVVEAVSGKCLDRLRRGSGPIFLPFSVERFAEHCGPGKSQDPCDWSRDWDVVKNMGIRERTFAGVDALKEFQEALAYAKSSPFPDPKTLEEGIYA